MKQTIARKYSDQTSGLQDMIAHYHNRGTLIYNGDRNSLRKIELNGQFYVIKAFGIPNVINRFVYRFFRKSKAERSFLYAGKLLSMGLGTPEPVAFFENKTGLILRDSYYISRWVETEMTFHQALRMPVGPERDEIVRGFALFTKKLHDHGILFKDHSPGNTLIHQKDGGHREFYLVDLNRMEFHELTYEERMNNFSRLTRDEATVRTMASEYARLMHLDPEKVFQDMWAATDRFWQKRSRTLVLKKKIFFWKEKYKNREL